MVKWVLRRLAIAVVVACTLSTTGCEKVPTKPTCDLANNPGQGATGVDAYVGDREFQACVRAWAQYRRYENRNVLDRLLTYGSF